MEGKHGYATDSVNKGSWQLGFILSSNNNKPELFLELAKNIKLSTTATGETALYYYS